MTTKPALILFDVNETLMDMEPLKLKINKLLGTGGFRIWFNMLLHYSLVSNSVGQYHDFSSLADAAFNMAAKALAITVSDKEKKAALATIKQLSAYPDVDEGLRLLKQNGFVLATLTNSPETTLMAQLNNANLTSYFDATFSVDTIKKYKPAPETYQWAAAQLSVNINDTLLIAAHGWDIAGALGAGMQAGFIERKGQSLFPLALEPQFTGKDLVELASNIIAGYSDTPRS